MEKLTLGFVFRQTPFAVLYFIFGSFVGAISSYVLFNINKNFLEFVISAWFKRILLGINLFGEKYNTFWFILNNIIALLVVIVASLLILNHVSKTPEFAITKKLKFLEKRRPKIMLTGLYMVPLGALLVNSFLISLFITYVFLNFGFERFFTVVLLLLPHGITEVFALILASSLGLAYLKILSDLILKGKWKFCSKTLKELIGSRVTLLIIIFVIILVIFGGLIEGSLGNAIM